MVFVLPAVGGTKRKTCPVKFNWRIEFEYGGRVGGCFSPDGELFAAAREWLVIVCRAGDGKQVAVYEGHTRAIRHISFSDDGKFIVTCSDDKTVKLWQAPAKCQDASPLASPRASRSPSPRVNVSDISKPIPILPNTHPVGARSPRGGYQQSPAHSPAVNRRLVRQNSYAELSPGTFAKGIDGKPEIDVYGKTLHHIHVSRVDDSVLGGNTVN